MRLILASTSPRRKEILSLSGLPFEVIPPDYHEKLSPSRSARQEARHHAAEKALSVAVRFPDDIIIGSDTLIELENEKIGKPKDTTHAKAILKKLSGQTHVIYTAAAVVAGRDHPGDVIVEPIRVTMNPYTDADIAAYVAAGEGMDKAGAYSLQGQGRDLIEWLEGDYLAAVGLPLRGVVLALQKAGLEPKVDVEVIYRHRTFMNWSTF